jgi:hypothetical protein
MFRLLLLLALLVFPVQAAPQKAPAPEPAPVRTEKTEAARVFFERYRKFMETGDPAAATLYADTARIRNVVRAAPGQDRREAVFNGKQYKSLLPSLLKEMREKKTPFSFSDVTFEETDTGVIIESMRTAGSAKLSSPHFLLIVRQTDGTWKIEEELAESAP